MSPRQRRPARAERAIARTSDEHASPAANLAASSDRAARHRSGSDGYAHRAATAPDRHSRT